SVAASADSELSWANAGHAVHPMASAMAIMRTSGRKVVLRGTLVILGAPSHEIQPPENRRLEAPQYLDKVNFSETNYNSSASSKRQSLCPIPSFQKNRQNERSASFR